MIEDRGSKTENREDDRMALIQSFRELDVYRMGREQANRIFAFVNKIDEALALCYRTSSGQWRWDSKPTRFSAPSPSASRDRCRDANHVTRSPSLTLRVSL